MKLGLAIIAILMMAGCFVKPKPLTTKEIQSRADHDLKVLAREQAPIIGPIDMYEAMARALKYNLETRVEVMKTMLAHSQLDLSHHSLLPQVVANGAFDGRSNFSGGTSISLLTGKESLEASTGSERNVFSTDLTLSWDVLDFGLSYVRAKQAADNVLIAKEEKRRVAIRVMQDVRKAYWRAVGAARVIERLAFLDGWVSKALENSRNIQEQQLMAPLTALQYQRELIDRQREIQAVYREFATAKIELANLMNLRPGDYYELVIPEREALTPKVNAPVEIMEQKALLDRPELRALDYRKRINAKETKAAILEMLPNLDLTFGLNYNTNKLLFYNNWLAYGAKISWNLLRVFKQMTKMKTIEAEGQVLDTQGLALTMAVMTQVHVGVAQFANAKNELTTAKQYYETQSRIVDQIRLSWMRNRLGEPELIRERVNHVLAELRYDAARANLEAAFANLLAAMGEDLVPDSITGTSIDQLSGALRTHWNFLATHSATAEKQKKGA